MIRVKSAGGEASVATDRKRVAAPEVGTDSSGKSLKMMKQGRKRSYGGGI
jgi:hypothetical protein